MSEPSGEAAAEPVTECPDCSRTWTVADVDAVLVAKKRGNRMLLAAILVLVIGVFAAVGVPLVGIPILVFGFGLGVWSVIINRKPLRALTTVPLDEHTEQQLKRLQGTTLKLGWGMLAASPVVVVGVLYFSLTRGRAMVLFFVAAAVFCVVWFYAVGFFQRLFKRLFKRKVQCPGCLHLRVVINFLPKNKEEALQQLRAIE